MGKNAEENGRADPRVRGSVDPRSYVGAYVGKIDLTAIGSHRHTEGGTGDGDRGTQSVRRGVDHRYGAGGEGFVCGIDLEPVGRSRYPRREGAYGHRADYGVRRRNDL